MMSKQKRLVKFLCVMGCLVPSILRAETIPNWILNPIMEGRLTSTWCDAPHKSEDELVSWAFADLAKQLGVKVQAIEKKKQNADGSAGPVIELGSKHISSHSLGPMISVSAMDKTQEVPYQMFESTAKVVYKLKDKTRTIKLYMRVGEGASSSEIDRDGNLEWNQIVSALLLSSDYQIYHEELSLGGKKKKCAFVSVKL